MTTPRADKIFISHAGDDQELGRLVKETLQLGGVPADRIFFSSVRSTGIHAGLDLRTQLQRELARAALVVELLTPTFFDRHMCLLELGAAWALQKPTFPMVVPPATLADAQAVLGEVIMWELTDDSTIESAFSELHDTIRDQLDLVLPSSGWNDSVRRFRSSLPEVVRRPPVSSPPRGPDRDATTSAGATPFTLSDIRWADAFGGGVKVMGRIENNTRRPCEIVALRAVFRRDRAIVETADGYVQQLAAGQTKTFTIDSYGSPVDFDDVQVEVSQHT